MSKIFEKASRMKLRFDTPLGRITVEDLWDLHLSGDDCSLDGVAQDLHRQLQETPTQSFVIKDEKPDPVVQLRFDIVKHVIEVRLAWKEAAEKAVETKAKKQRLLALIAEKQDDDLKGSSLEELEQMVADL